DCHDRLRADGIGPQGLLAPARKPGGSVSDPAQNPVSPGSADKRTGGGCDVSPSRVAGRESLTAPRRERRSARSAKHGRGASPLAAGARQYGGRQPRKRQQNSPELAPPGLDRPGEGFGADPRGRGPEAPDLSRSQNLGLAQLRGAVE